MNTYKKIAKTIYEENKQLFSSQAEVENIIITYINKLWARTKQLKETELPGIGKCVITKEGRLRLKQIEDKLRFDRNVKTLKYRKKRVKNWLDKFIDDSYPEKNI